ncbi:unnamed protein product [Caenorhabditis brenneri]
MGVPILKLPYLALKVLVDHFNYVELVTVSLASKRADWVLKTCGKKPVPFFDMQGSDIKDICDFDKFALVLLESRRQGVPPDWSLKICCIMIDENYFSIICNNYYTTSIVPIYFDTIENIETFNGDRRSLKIGESLVPVVISKENDGRDQIRTFWSSEADGMMELMDYFMKTFNLPLEELKFASKDTGAIRTVCNHIHSNQIVVRTVQVRSFPQIPDDDFKLILKNVSATERFSSRMKTSKTFVFDGKIHAKDIEIQNGHWFTLRNLLMCTESELIQVKGSGYTKEEYRTVLSEWKAEKFPKLKKLKLGTIASLWDVTEGFETREGGCGKCHPYNTIVTIKGHGDSHCCVQTIPGKGFHFMIHDK